MALYTLDLWFTNIHHDATITFHTKTENMNNSIVFATLIFIFEFHCWIIRLRNLCLRAHSGLSKWSNDTALIFCMKYKHSIRLYNPKQNIRSIANRGPHFVILSLPQKSNNNHEISAKT